jgi:hypothetical protein
MSKRLVQEGIACEVRHRLVPGGLHSDYKEIWVQIENDLQWASSLLAMHCAVGRN